MQSHLSTRTTFSGSVRTVNTFGLWRDNFAANPLSIFDIYLKYDRSNGIKNSCRDTGARQKEQVTQPRP
ncbi:hypothetical protein F2P81_008010 [Scophthalmus maximus]|uniref:Uncharacterized protein n=1 Tax=Scophthalmus maximus TaxID=52904 RepID=A0A6A4T3S1_SCOMX|nr:hypothetical protein F2P81_008010 [Scophthalmus maximus]